MAGPIYFDTNLSGTGLWKRCRILGVEGKAVGLEDDVRDGYWVYLKICGEGDCDSKMDKQGRGDIGFFFRVGVDGYMLEDSPENQNLCTLYNLSLLNSMIPDFIQPYIGDEVPQTQPPAFEWLDATGDGYFDGFDTADNPLETTSEYSFDEDWFSLENNNTHEADLQALKDKLAEIQKFVPKIKSSERLNLLKGWSQTMRKTLIR